MWDSIFIDCHLATFASTEPYGAVHDGALGVVDGRIAFVGRRATLTAAPEQLAHTVYRLGGAWVTPGLVDCHTHVIYAGNGVRDFEMRLAGPRARRFMTPMVGCPVRSGEPERRVMQSCSRRRCNVSVPWWPVA